MINPKVIKDRICKILLVSLPKIDAIELRRCLELNRHMITDAKTENIRWQLQTNQFDWIIIPAEAFFEDISREECSRITSEAGVIVFSSGKNPSLKTQLRAVGIEACIMGGEGWELRVAALTKALDASKMDADAHDYIALIFNKTKQNKALTVIIFKKLFAELPEQLAAIEKNLRNCLYVNAWESVHKLHGSVSFCDLEYLRQPAYDLEICLQTQNHSAADFYFAELEQRLMHFMCCRPWVNRHLDV
jgi:HPt (histidine-containing phosphotransfer) domain-containing protein